MAQKSGTGMIMQDEFSRFNYSENFSVVSPCLRYECGVCYRPVQVFKRPRIILLGAPLNDPRAIKLDKLHELKEYAKILSALSILNAAADSPEDDAYYYHYLEEQQQGKEKQQEEEKK